MRILVIDDDSRLAKVLARWLAALGHETTIACDPTNAVRLVANVDLVISDIDMPLMNGIELAGYLREVQPELPIVFTSGRAHDDLIVQAAKAARRFLPKPYTGEELEDVIRAVAA